MVLAIYYVKDVSPSSTTVPSKLSAKSLACIIIIFYICLHPDFVEAPWCPPHFSKLSLKIWKYNYISKCAFNSDLNFLFSLQAIKSLSCQLQSQRKLFWCIWHNCMTSYSNSCCSTNSVIFFQSQIFKTYNCITNY